MKRIFLLLPCLVLPSCITVTGELALPGSGQPGALGGSIRGSWSWAGPKEAEPVLPVEPFGKSPVPAVP